MRKERRSSVKAKKRIQELYEKEEAPDRGAGVAAAGIPEAAAEAAAAKDAITESAITESAASEAVAKEAAGDGQWMKMEFQSSSQNEEFARVAVAVFISRMDPTLEEINDVKTAVSEAVTNCVIHGYENGEGIIYIETGIDGQELTVSVRDEGRGIEDIRRAMEPMYTSDVSGERSGMGFSFMEAFMDQVNVESEPGRGTMVIMKKKIGR